MRKAIKTNETVEARFYDDKKKGQPGYIGDVIGVLNVLANEKEYELTFRYVKVYFTDDNSWLLTSPGSHDNKLGTGPSARPPAIRVGSGDHTQAMQLRRGQDLMNLFNLGGSQHPYLEHIFRQALVHYNPPIQLADADAVAIDISEIFTRAEVRQGVGVQFIGSDISFPPRSGLGRKFTNSIQQLAKAKVNANKGAHDGVTMALIPYTFNNLFGVSDGIGGAAQNVFVTYLKHIEIARDRATAAHEALHSLGLYHSFIDGGGQIATYIIPANDAATKLVRENTENVMDYTPTARTLYKWQWEGNGKKFKMIYRM